MLKGILVPVADEIAAARVVCEGIVLVVHKPAAMARKAMKKIGMQVRPRLTTVAGVSNTDAVAALGHDVVTRRWWRRTARTGRDQGLPGGG